VKLDDDGKKVVDISKPDNAIPERLSLLPTALLQKIVLRLLAGGSDSEMIGSGPSFGKLKFDGQGADGGTLAIAVDTGDEELVSDNPFAARGLLTVSVHQLGDDGRWKKAPEFTKRYVKNEPRRIELAWPAGGALAAGRYRVSIENDLAQPAVDARMRPLPSRWARHFRLESKDGYLTLADSIHS
jgi:hypothetical protein